MQKFPPLFIVLVLLTAISGCLEKSELDGDTDNNSTETYSDSVTSEEDTHTDTATGTGMDTGTDSDTASDTATHTSTHTDDGMDTATDTETATDADSGTATDKDTETATGTDSGTATETDTGTATGTDSGTATDTDTETATGTDSDTATAENPDTATETASESMPPAFVSMTPAGTDVDIPPRIVVTFSEAIAAESVAETTFVVSGPNGPVAGALEVTGDTVTFTPEQRLGLMATYEVEMTSDVTDVDGNRLKDAPVIRNFSVRDGEWQVHTIPADWGAGAIIASGAILFVRCREVTTSEYVVEGVWYRDGALGTPFTLEEFAYNITLGRGGIDAIATNNTGDAVVLGHAHSGAESTLYAWRYADGTWSSTQTVGIGYIQPPWSNDYLALDDRGNVFVLAEPHDAGDIAVFQYRPLIGWLPVRVLDRDSDDNYITGARSIAVDHRGNAATLWMVSPETNEYSVKISHYSASDDRWKQAPIEVLAESSDSGSISLSMNRMGETLVVASTSETVNVATLLADQRWAETSFTSTAPIGQGRKWAGYIQDNGFRHVVWTDNEQAGVWYAISSDGEAWTAPDVLPLENSIWITGFHADVNGNAMLYVNIPTSYVGTYLRYVPGNGWTQLFEMELRPPLEGGSINIAGEMYTPGLSGADVGLIFQ